MVDNIPAEYKLMLRKFYVAGQAWHEFLAI